MKKNDRMIIIQSRMTRRVPYFLIAFLFLLRLNSFGQACTPDPQYTNTNTQRGVHPDTITNLATAYVGVSYAQTITIVVPPDTAVPILGKIVWDSTVLVNVSGLPTGFTYACSNTSSKPNRCSWKGNSIGCLIITGTALSADTGTHPLLFSTNNYVGGNATPTPYTAKGYKIVVKSASGVNENTNIRFLQQNNPNPFSDVSEIQFFATNNDIVHFKIYNILGETIQEFNVNAKKGMNKLTVDAKDFNSGIYFYSFTQGTDLITRKMIVEK